MNSQIGHIGAANGMHWTIHTCHFLSDAGKEKQTNCFKVSGFENQFLAFF